MIKAKSRKKLLQIGALMAAVMITVLCALSMSVNAATDYCKTWKDYKATYGKPDKLTWNFVVDTMEDVLDAADDIYKGGDVDGGVTAINDAYYGYYEITGFEKTTMGAISGSRVSAMEFEFKACKTAMKGNESAENVTAKIDELRSMLREDANKLDGTSGVTRHMSKGKVIDGNEDADAKTNEISLSTDDSDSDDEVIGASANSDGFNMVNFLACFGIILREGFEAILVVGAIIAYLVKSGNKDKLKVVYIGSLLAILCSFGAAWLLDALKLANSANQEIIEGVTALIAVLVLFYVSNWMVSKAESDAWSKYIDDQVKVSTETGRALTLGFTAFLAVFREGAEVILFYQPLISSSNGNVFPVWLGFGVGCVCLVFVYIIIRFFSVKLPIRPFFLGTSILMFVMSISFLGSGIKELIEGDVISYTSPELRANLIPVNDVFDVLGIYPCFETLIPQLILILITLMIFVLQKWKTKNKNEAGVLAIVMGGLGIHKFYLGKYGQGLLYLAFCWTFIPAFIGVAEGIHFLTETQEQFEEELKPKAKKPRQEKGKPEKKKVKAKAEAAK